jgi:hypothetical protein
MSGSTTCPGCGLELPASGWLPDPRRNASPECWRLFGEVQGFELRHLELVRDYHQLAVDVYQAQHAPPEHGGVPPIGVAYALVGLHLRWTAGRRVWRSAPRTSGWASRTRPGRAWSHPGRPAW